MPAPTLSVFMPNFNHGQFLRHSVQAILDQSFEPHEFIIIDDASTDDSVPILREFADKYPGIRLIINDTNRGVLYNIQIALGLATGLYIYGASADDQILPGFFEKSMNLLSQHPDAGLCSCLSWTVDEQRTKKWLPTTFSDLKHPCFITPQRVGKLYTKSGCWIQGNTVIYRREALLAVGGFREELLSHCDAFAYEVISLKYGACFIPAALAVSRNSRTSYSGGIWSNLDISMTIWRRANSLMRITYKDIYPLKYVNRLDSSKRCSTLTARWDVHVESFKSELYLIFADKPASLVLAQSLLRGISLFSKFAFTVFLGTPIWKIRSMCRRLLFSLKTFRSSGLPDL